MCAHSVDVLTLPAWGGGLIIDTQNSNILFLIGGIFYFVWVIMFKGKYSELQGTGCNLIVRTDDTTFTFCVTFFILFG
jgi:hypothetical protein